MKYTKVIISIILILTLLQVYNGFEISSFYRSILGAQRGKTDHNGKIFYLSYIHEFLATIMS